MHSRALVRQLARTQVENILPKEFKLANFVITVMLGICKMASRCMIHICGRIWCCACGVARATCDGVGMLAGQVCLVARLLAAWNKQFNARRAVRAQLKDWPLVARRRLLAAGGCPFHAALLSPSLSAAFSVLAGVSRYSNPYGRYIEVLYRIMFVLHLVDGGRRCRRWLKGSCSAVAVAMPAG